MKPSTALEMVSKAYVPGVAKFYAGLTPDPWMQAHERLEGAMLACDELITDSAAESFASECIQLINNFKSAGIITKGVSAADSLYLGDVDRVRKHQSRKHKVCFKCETKEGLSIVADPLDPASVIISCQKCAPKKASRAS
jgi:hypothetical protein